MNDREGNEWLGYLTMTRDGAEDIELIAEVTRDQAAQLIQNLERLETHGRDGIWAEGWVPVWEDNDGCEVYHYDDGKWVADFSYRPDDEV